MRNASHDFQPETASTHFLPYGKLREGNLLAIDSSDGGGAMDDVEVMVTSLYARGFSAREIEVRVRQISNLSVSAAAITNVGAKLQAYIAEWKGRLLSHVYAMLFVDDMAFKVARNGRLTHRNIRVVAGIGADGRMEILSVWPGMNGRRASWRPVFMDLRARGVEQVLVTCADAGIGLGKAFSGVFNRDTFHVRRRGTSTINGARSSKQAECDGCLAKRPPAHPAHYNFLDPVCACNYYHEESPDFFLLTPGIQQLAFSTNASQYLFQRINALRHPNMIFPDESALVKTAFVALRQVNEQVAIRVRHWNQLLQEFAAVQRMLDGIRS